MLTVAELIKQLQGLDPALPVVLQSDPEGNRYLHCRGADDDAKITGNDGRDLDVMSVDDAEEEGYSKSPQCVVLYP